MNVGLPNAALRIEVETTQRLEARQAAELERIACISAINKILENKCVITTTLYYRHNVVCCIFAQFFLPHLNHKKNYA
jgi:hypothetical protein